MGRVANIAGRTLRVLLVTLLVGVALAAGTLVFLTQTGPGRSIVLGMVVDLVNRDILHGELGVERLEGGFISGIRLRGVTLRDLEGEPVLRVDEVEARYALRPLLRGRIQVDLVRLDGADVVLVFDEEGQLTLLDLIVASEEETPPLSLHLDIDRIEVADTRVQVWQTDAGRLVRVAALEGLEVGASFRMRESGAMRAEIDHLRAGWTLDPDGPAEEELRLDRLHFAMEGDTLSAELAAIQAAGSRLEGLKLALEAGWDEPTPLRAMALQFALLEVAPRTLEPWVEGVELLQPLRIEAALAGPADALEGQVTLRAEEGLEPVQLALGADLQDLSRPKWRAHLSLVDFDPNLLVRLDEGPLPPMQLSLGLHVEGEGMDPDDLVADLRLDMGPSPIAGYALEGLWLSASWAERELALRRIQLWAAGLALEASGSATLDGAVALRLAFDAPDLATLRPLMPDLPPMGGALRLLMEAEGALDIEAVEALLDDPVELGFHVLDNLAVETSAKVRGLRVDSLRIASADLRVRSGLGSADQLWVHAMLRELRDGDLRIRQSESELQVRDRVLRLRSEGLGLPGDLRWRVDLRAGLDGRRAWSELLALHVDASGLHEGLRVALARPGWIEAELDESWSPQSLEVRAVELDLLEARATLSGGWRASGALQADIGLSGLMLERLAPLLPEEAPEVAGRLDAAASFRGSLRAPRMEVRASLQGGQVQDLRNVQLSLDASYAQDMARVALDSSAGKEELLRLEGTLPLRLDLERGRADLIPARELSLVFRTPGIQLADLVLIEPSLAAYDLAGLFSGEGEIGGSLETLRADVSIRLEDVGATLELPGLSEPWRVEPLTWTLRAAYGVDGGRGLDAASSLLWGTREIFAAEAAFSADIRELYDDPSLLQDWLQELTGRLSVQVGDVDVSLVPEELLEGSGLESGGLAATLEWAGTLEGGALEIALDLVDFGLQGVPPFDLRTDIRVEDEIELMTGLRWEGREVLRLELGIEDSLRSLIERGVRLEQEIQGRVLLQEVFLRDAARWVDFIEDDESAVLQGYVDLFGTVGAPELFGRVALRGVQLFDGSEGLLTSELRYREGELSMETLLCDGSRDGLAALLRVGVPLDTQALLEGDALPPIQSWPVGGSVTVDTIELGKLLPEALASAFVQDVRGALSADLTLDGTIGEPAVDGFLRVEQAAMVVVPLGRRFDEVNLRVAMRNDEVRLEELFVRSGRGEMRATGQVELEEWWPVRLAIDSRFDRFLLADPTGMGVYLTGAVDVRGQTEADLLGVDVTLRNARVDVPDDIGGDAVGPTSISGNVLFIGEDVDISQVGQRNPRRLGADEETFFDNLMVDLRIRTQGNNELRHSLATIRFEVDLGLRMEGSTMSARGHVNLPSGEIRVAGRRLDIERGRIDFEGEGDEAFDPALDIRALHVLSTSVAANLEPASGERATITIGVGGKASDPTITLQSDPGMSEEDIIFVLLTGRPRAGEDTDADAQSQVLATAGNLALGMLADRLPGEIPIDTIRIESDAQEGQAISRVEGGKYIRENLYLSVTYIPSATDRENDVELALEWILRRIGPGSIRLEIRGGNAQKGGIEMLYNISRQ